MAIRFEPNGVIIARLGIEPNGRVNKFLTNTCYRHMDKYVPMKEGNLRINADIQEKYIIYESPYAEYQYYGMREDGSHKVRNYTTPGTGPYWDNRMWSAEKKDVIEEVQSYIRR